MRNQIIAAVALMSVVNAGCFTVLGGVVGSMSDGPPRQPPPRQPVVVDGPPGTPGYDFRPVRAARVDDSGMTGAGKGLLIGLVIDAALIGATAYALSQMNFGGGWGCGDDGECSD